MNEYEIAFTRQQLNDLRQQANRLWMQAEYLDAEEGWSRSRFDVQPFLEVFTGIKCKPDMELFAFQFREGQSGNGLLLVCPKVLDATTLLEHIKANHDWSLYMPERHFKAALDGWGPMALSIFLKEALEFGAFGHGINWQDQEIIDDDFWNSSEEPVSFLGEPFNKPVPELWLWRTEEPVNFNPGLKMSKQGLTTVFYTMSYREKYYLREHKNIIDEHSGALLSYQETIIAETE